MLAQDDIDTGLIWVLAEGVYEVALHVFQFVLDLAHHAFLAVAGDFGDGGVRADVDFADVVALLGPEMLKSLYYWLSCITKSQSIFQSLSSKYLFNIKSNHSKHFLQHHHSNLRLSHIRPIQRVQTINSKHSLLHFQNFPGFSVFNKKSKVVETFTHFSY